jgi:hypothetical protein
MGFEKRVKIRVKFSLCLTKSAPCHEDVGGCKIMVPPFLTSVLDISVVRFTLRPHYPRYPFDRGWVGIRAGLDAAKIKFS